MHVLVRFRDVRIAEQAAAMKVQIVSSASFYLTEPPANEFILGFSSTSERSIREAIRRLAGITQSQA
jgi:DNA-binding transcriptional MocR family regulator